jgi:hypothetical protein
MQYPGLGIGDEYGNYILHVHLQKDILLAGESPQTSQPVKSTWNCTLIS